MRLGTKIVLAGVVIILIGLVQSPYHETSTFSCDIPNGFGGTDCGTVTSQEPNNFRSFQLALGSFLFTVGIGGWIGTIDAQGRIRREMEEREDKNIET
jgi:hypothetical protein